MPWRCADPVIEHADRSTQEAPAGASCIERLRSLLAFKDDIMKTEITSLPASNALGPGPVQTAVTTGACWRPRLRAAAVHFLLSLTAVGGAIVVLATQWYPGALLYAAGGLKLLLMIALIDLVLGPALTMVVFDRRKKSLPFDLAFIALMQLGALTYGLNASYQGRPVFEVFAVDRFELLSAAEVDADELRLANPKFATLAKAGPLLAAVLAPTDTKSRNELAQAAASGIDLKFFLRYYVDYASQRRNVLAVAKPIDDLIQLNSLAAVDAALAAAGFGDRNRQSMRFVPLSGKREDLTMLIDAGNAQPIALLRLVPWKD